MNRAQASRPAQWWVLQVPFVVDVLAPNYPPASSKRIKLAAGDTQVDDIVMGEPGATVVVVLLDKSDSPVTGVPVILLADPVGLDSGTRGSWLHHRAFRQRGVTSGLGNARFTGVPPGRIIVRVKTASSSTEQRAELRFIQPGKPTQNAFVESFNGKFRDACLNSHWFVDINDARRSIETWRVHYNTVRPHSSLGFLSPEQFRMAGETGCGKDGRSATLENSTSFPLSHSHDGGDNSPNSSLSTWT